jgi:hypothetical protein
MRIWDTNYGKKATTKAVKQWFEVANDLWREGKKVLDACVPCQLFKKAPDYGPTAAIR